MCRNNIDGKNGKKLKKLVFRILDETENRDNMPQSSYYYVTLKFMRFIDIFRRKTFRIIFNENYYADGLGKDLPLDKDCWLYYINFYYDEHVENIFNYKRILSEKEKEYLTEIQKGRQYIIFIIYPYIKTLFARGESLPEQGKIIKPLIDPFLIASYRFCKQNFVSFLLDAYFSEKGAAYNTWDEKEKISKIIFVLGKALPLDIFMRLAICKFDVSLLTREEFFYLFSLLIATLPCFLFADNREKQLILLQLNIENLEDFYSLKYSTYSINYEKVKI